MYLHSCFNNAINIIFGQLHATAALLSVKNPLNKSLSMDDMASCVLYFSLVSTKS